MENLENSDEQRGRMSSAKKTVSIIDPVYFWILKHMELTGSDNFSKALNDALILGLVAMYPAFETEAKEKGLV